MAQQLEPEKVDVQDIPEWIRQSHGLILRRWQIFLSLCLLHVLVSVWTEQMGYLTLPLGYFITLCFLATFIFVARAADESVQVSYAAVIALLQKLVTTLVILAVLISVITVAAVALGSWLLPLLPEAASQVGAPTAGLIGMLTDWTVAAVMRFFVVILSLVVAGMWFLLPLLVFHSLSLLESALLSKKAERINISVVLMVAYAPLFALITLLLLHDISYPITAMLVPYFGAIQYVSYRHVFTQKKKNSPARALLPALESLTA